MTGPILVPNLATLRAEFDQRWPRRDKRSDGWIGDQSHAVAVSGHNPDESGKPERTDADRVDEVRAIDLDADIDPAPADELYAELDRIRLTPALRRRLIYIIYRRKIASASNGWVWKDYTGDSPHTEHGHVSGHPDYDDDTTPWGVATAKGDGMSFFDEKQIDGRTGAQLVKDVWWLLVKGNPGTALYQSLTQLGADLGEVDVDEQAIVSGVLAGLTPEAIAAAIPPALTKQVADELAKRLVA